MNKEAVMLLMTTDNIRWMSNPRGGGTDPKITYSGSAWAKKLDLMGSVHLKIGGRKDPNITKMRGQKDLWNIQLVQKYFF